MSSVTVQISLNSDNVRNNEIVTRASNIKQDAAALFVLQKEANR